MIPHWLPYDGLTAEPWGLWTAARTGDPKDGGSSSSFIESGCRRRVMLTNHPYLRRAGWYLVF